MINNDILNFIKGELQKGVPAEEIKRQLTSSGGWTHSDVEEAFRIINPVPISGQSIPPTIPPAFVGGTLIKPVVSKSNNGGIYILLGLGGVILGGIISVFSLQLPLTKYVLYYFVAILVVGLLASAILLILTKILKVLSASWSKAIFIVGYSSLVGSIVQFTQKFIGVNAIISLIISLVAIVCWFAIFMKIYQTKFGKTFLIAFLESFIVGILVTILTFTIGFSLIFNFMFNLSNQIKQPQNPVVNQEESIVPTSTESIPVSNNSGPSITITSPNGGENYKIGDTVNIVWTSSNLGSSNVTIGWCKVNSKCGTVVPHIPNQGSYSWHISGATITSGDYRITVTNDADNSLQDQSDTYFTISSSNTSSASNPSTNTTTSSNPTSSNYKKYTGEGFSVEYPSTYTAKGLISTSGDPKDPKVYSFELVGNSMKNRLNIAVYDKNFKSKNDLVNSLANESQSQPQNVSVAGKVGSKIENTFSGVTNVVLEDSKYVYDLIGIDNKNPYFEHFYNSFMLF